MPRRESWQNIRKDWFKKEQERWVGGRVFYCLHGVEHDFETIRQVSRRWLDKGGTAPGLRASKTWHKNNSTLREAVRADKSHPRGMSRALTGERSRS